MKSFILNLVLALLILLVFWQVRTFGFINYDDDSYVYENQHVLTGLTSKNIIWAFTTGDLANWHPFTWLSLMLDCQLFGPNPGWLHLENVFLHLINSLLLFAILKKMSASLWPSAFVAAAFALHPMHVESVVWITERKDVLSTLFFMLTLAVYIGYIKRPGLSRYLLTILIFALGLLAKPMLVTLPFLLLLLDYWQLNRFELQPEKISGRRAQKSAINSRASLYCIIIEKVPFFILCVISGVITFLVQQSGGIVNAAPMAERLANAFLSYVRYIGKMFWPQNLAIFYPFIIHAFSLWQIVLCILLLLIISVLVIRFRHNNKYLPVGWFWFVITLLPVIGLIQVGNQAYADRYSYIPYIGLFIIIAWGAPQLLSKWPHKKIVLGASMSVVLTVLGICTYRQISFWHDDAALFSHALEVTENNYIAHDHLALALSKQGQSALAIEHFNKALEIKPDYAHAALSLGLVFANKGDFSQAIEYFQKTLQLESSHSNAAAYARYNLGLALRNLNKFGESLDQFSQAVRLKPDFIEARYNLGIALSQQGRLDEALDQFRAVSQLKPDLPDPMNDIAWYIATHPELKSRDANEALFFARRACELTNYNNPAFLGTLAAAYAYAGKFPEAVDTARKAVTLAEISNNPQIKNILEYHLSFYTQGKPYIEPPPTLPAEPNRP